MRPALFQTGACTDAKHSRLAIPADLTPQALPIVWPAASLRASPAGAFARWRGRVGGPLARVPRQPFAEWNASQACRARLAPAARPPLCVLSWR